jgi:hypothetical protein
MARVGLLLIALVSIPPILLERAPIQFIRFDQSPILQISLKIVVTLALIATIAIGAWAERRVERWSGALALLFMVLAGAMTACHWLVVDRYHFTLPPPASGEFYTETWQRWLYEAVLNHDQARRPGLSPVPHVFRPLPYGFTRTLERLTGDWNFACILYRWFFTYWFLWGSYRFIRLFHPPPRALEALIPIVLLYPFSIWHYGGQLTDPMSHALFVLALIYVVEDRWLDLAAALALGILAKETVMVVVPAYLVCQREQRSAALWKTVGLALVCVTAFAAPREIDFVRSGFRAASSGWWPTMRALNGARGLMIGTNLGIGTPLDKGLGSNTLPQNALHVFLFIAVFLPAIIRHWRMADSRLKSLFIVLVPLVLLSSLCFSWLYESRNYMPLLPVVTALALRPRPGVQEGSESPPAHTR